MQKSQVKNRHRYHLAVSPKQNRPCRCSMLFIHSLSWQSKLHGHILRSIVFLAGKWQRRMRSRSLLPKLGQLWASEMTRRGTDVYMNLRWWPLCTFTGFYFLLRANGRPKQKRVQRGYLHLRINYLWTVESMSCSVDINTSIYVPRLAKSVRRTVAAQSSDLR